MIITIDGPSASGKSSVAISVSRRLGFVCINSGAAYRVITKLVIEKDLQDASEKQIIEFLEKYLDTVVISWHTDDLGMKIKCNGIDVTQALFDPKIDLYVSKIAAIEMVRESVNATLIAISKTEKDVCFEGRDMGAVVFSNADIKIFLTANAEVRAKRRFEQSKNNSDVSYEDILYNINVRDDKDLNREISPLKIPEGSSVFDSSYYSLEETVDILEERIRAFKEI